MIEIRKDSCEKFFKGFEYTVKSLPHNVVSCLDAACAKEIPLKNELKSLVLMTDKGLYLLNIPGDMYADLRAVKKFLNVDEAYMASEANLRPLGVKKGTVCPAINELWNLPQLVSEEVLSLDFVSTNNGKLDEYIMFKPAELLKHRKMWIGKFARSQRKLS
jgi:prolyl-tRNA editing enzyme YbaK/EbsC (Cys-tRNA(Pro) deacylase)